MEHEHHHAHGPANRRRIMLATAAPLFVCEPLAEAPGAAVIALHGPHGITAEFERALRALAAHGYLAAAPFHYYRDGGPEYVSEAAASSAYAALDADDIDADVDAAIEHVSGRLGLPVTAVLGPDSVARALRRARQRHPELAAVALPESDADAPELAPAGWLTRTTSGVSGSSAPSPRDR